MYESVLIPTDGSEHAERGVEHGLELAEIHDAGVQVLFVVDESVHGATPAVSGYEAFLEKVEDEAEGVLEDVVDRAEVRGLDAEPILLRGRPEEEILSLVEENDIDVVVMGRRGASSGDATRLGSVTERVLRNADVTVIPV